VYGGRWARAHNLGHPHQLYSIFDCFINTGSREIGHTIRSFETAEIPAGTHLAKLGGNEILRHERRLGYVSAG
jgi:hypothetical protein